MTVVCFELGDERRATTAEEGLVLLNEDGSTVSVFLQKFYDSKNYILGYGTEGLGALHPGALLSSAKCLMGLGSIRGGLGYSINSFRKCASFDMHSASDVSPPVLCSSLLVTVLCRQPS